MFNSLKQWSDLELDENTEKNLQAQNYLAPSKIQGYAIPLIMHEPHENLIAQAHNGSGKTVAFILGSMSRVDTDSEQIQVIILGHTREMVIQISDIFKKVAKNTGIKVGIMISQQESGDNASQQVVVCTAGILKQKITRNKIDLTGLKVFVIDEADFMFLTG